MLKKVQAGLTRGLRRLDAKVISKKDGLTEEAIRVMLASYVVEELVGANGAAKKKKKAPAPAQTQTQPHGTVS